jgi:hypothetical protein
MNDSSPGTSLAMRARRLTALARAERDDRELSQAQGQVQTALNKLDQELGALAGVLAVHRRLKQIGVPVVDPTDLEKPVGRLKEQAALGRPTGQFLNARTREVVGARSAIEDADAEAWRSWSTRSIEGLPLALLPRLPFTHRNATATRITSMRALAARKPSIADISQFMQYLDRVKDELGEVESAGIDSLLERFLESRILLADLSDEELEMLRADASLSDQLYVQIAR